jgi:hypothetical protein
VHEFKVDENPLGSRNPDVSKQSFILDKAKYCKSISVKEWVAKYNIEMYLI